MTTIFYSWQADTPTNVGRNFIERALQAAIKKISADVTIEVPIRNLEIDRDTKGVAGSPPIADTIFRKIDEASIFLADLTFVGQRRDHRPTPNPNVLIEYGWALKTLGHNRIIPVMNSIFGKPSAESLPFNLRHLRHPIQFECDATADDETRKKVRDALANQLEDAIRAIFESKAFKTSSPKDEGPKKFEPRKSAVSRPGRFREPTASLGISDHFISRPSHEVKLVDQPDVWLRLMPIADPEKTWLITDLRKAATEQGFLRPLGVGWTEFNFLRGEDGFGIYAPIRRSEDDTASVVYAFESGEVWSVESYVLEALKQENIVPDVEQEFRSALKNYGEFLSKLGVQPPFRWIGGMESLKGRRLYDPSGRMAAFRGFVGSCSREIVIAEGIYSPGDSLASALKPFFVRLFDACGVARSPQLDA